MRKGMGQRRSKEVSLTVEGAQKIITSEKRGLQKKERNGKGRHLKRGKNDSDEDIRHWRVRKTAKGGIKRKRGNGWQVNGRGPEKRRGPSRGDHRKRLSECAAIRG